MKYSFQLQLLLTFFGHDIKRWATLLPPSIHGTYKGSYLCHQPGEMQQYLPPVQVFSNKDGLFTLARQPQGYQDAG